MHPRGHPEHATHNARGQQMSHDFRLVTRSPELLVLAFERLAETDRARGADRLGAITASAHPAVKSTDLSDPLDHIC